MGKRETIKLLMSFKSRASRKFPITTMVLFGSRITGKPHKDSDVDLVIVSPKFRGLNFFKRGGSMYKFWDYDLPVDFLCYTPEEFSKLKRQVSIVSEALKEGVEI